MQQPNSASTLPTEQWAPVALNARYRVSNHGHVNGPRGALKLLALKNGYLGICIGKGRMQTVHRLVALAFVPGRSDERDIVNHIDGDKHNNVAANLEWCSRAENIAHAVRTGLQPCIGTQRGAGNRRLSVAQVAEIRARAGSASCAALAAEYSVHRDTVRKVIAGRTWPIAPAEELGIPPV